MTTTHHREAPLSVIATPPTRPFWQALDKGRFVVQRCSDCGAHQFYPGPLCRSCWCDDLAWVEPSGKGPVWTFTVARRPAHPHWSDQVPYVIADVELDEGPRLTTNVVGCDPSEVHVGRRVTAAFDTEVPGRPLLQSTLPQEEG
ncbi:Zn-ribbon domain-containing OB-fold protein [Streptomyces sp. NPDC057565]|uniref:Zn-ribbon domain-containing OB-fold protein n=1 Tax=Streptomyces sp. NPDC057565 TaxID=3346169 RepID=UPI0036AB30BE